MKGMKNWVLKVSARFYLAIQRAYVEKKGRTT